MIKSPYRRGAEDGVIFGIYLTFLFYAMVYSQQFAILALPALALIVAVPVVIYLMMKRYARSLNGGGTFSMLWMQGLVIFACGCAIGGLMLFIYMRWINPDFIRSQIEALANLDTAGAFASLNESKDMAEKILSAGMVPRAIDMVIELILLGIVSGSILSMIIAAIMSLFSRPNSPTYNQ